MFEQNTQTPHTAQHQQHHMEQYICARRERTNAKKQLNRFVAHVLPRIAVAVYGSRLESDRHTVQCKIALYIVRLVCYMHRHI